MLQMFTKCWKSLDWSQKNDEITKTLNEYLKKNLNRINELLKKIFFAM